MLDLQGGLDTQTRKAVEQLLVQLPSMPSDNKRAWALRHAIDAVLDGGEIPSPDTGPVTSVVAKVDTAAGSHAKTASVQGSSSAPAAAGSDIPTSREGANVASRVALLEGKTAAAAATSSSESKTAADTRVAAGDGDMSGKVIAEVKDDGWEEELACSICLEFLWEPVRLGCGHNFCRCCLLRATQLSPDGGSCPNCRTKIDVDPDTAPADAALEARVKAVVSAPQPPSALDAQPFALNPEP